MGKRKVEKGNHIYDYWIWDFPEIVSEIPSLFESAGVASVVSVNGNSVSVELKLHKPLSIIRGQTSENGLTINTSTATCVGEHPEVRVYQLPKNGDMVITFVMDLELETSIEYKAITIDEMREKIKVIAQKMTEIWGIL